MEMTETPTADKGPIFAFGGSHGRMDPGEGRIGPSERPLQSLLQSRACSWGRAGRKSWRVSRAEQSRAEPHVLALHAAVCGAADTSHPAGCHADGPDLSGICHRQV